MPIIKNCEYCGVEFKTNPSRLKRFCSINCSSKRTFSIEYRKKISISKKLIKLSEESKNKMRISHIGNKLSEETKKKISDKHKTLLSYKRLDRTGKRHKDETKIKISKSLKGILFTEQHKENIKKNILRGELHNNRKGGISPENTTIRKSIEGRLRINEVFKKDNWKCRKCFNSGFLNAHHILSFSKHKELRMDINNGITLCFKCHKEIHKIYGNNTTKEHLNDYLTYNI